jgi:hypothetical protein
MTPFCLTCSHARHVHATETSDWTGCRVIGCSCSGWHNPEIDQRIAEVLATAPPLTDDQVARVARLLAYLPRT